MSIENGSKQSKEFDFEEFRDEFEREVSEGAPDENQILALSRVDNNSLDVEKLRQLVVKNAHLLPLEMAEKYSAIILNSPFGSQKYRIGLLKALSVDEKRRLSRFLEAYSLAAIKFIVLEPMLFEMLKREAYEVRNLTKTEIKNSQQQTRAKWNWNDTFAEPLEESSPAGKNGDREDISDLTSYYEIRNKLDAALMTPKDIKDLKFVRFILQDFLQSGGSDLHMRGGRRFGTISYRINGTMQERLTGIPVDLFRIFVSAMCAIAGKDASKMTRGKVASVVKLIAKFEGEIKDVEFRFQSLPTDYCPSIVMRGHPKPFKDLSLLGFLPEQLKDVIRATEQPSGMNVITGPTGSGKTNTQYAALTRIWETRTPGSADLGSPFSMIELGSPIEFDAEWYQVTIPDMPTEREQEIIYQARFKDCLRFDPDVIAFTEIRSIDEAKIGFRAATSGHLAFGTLHAADVEETLALIFGWNIERDLIARSINIVIAQKLVKKLCDSCKIYDEETSALAGDGSTIFLENEAGCVDCEKGVAGRTIVAEVLYFDDRIRKLIVEGCKPSEIVARAKEWNMMIPMKDVARRKICSGIVSEARIVALFGLQTEVNDELFNTAVAPAVAEENDDEFAEVIDAEYEDV